ncbi:hypothetical protein DYB34_007542 [Aphanomyces astaci]|uniref:Uncharacterized protein n=1 Tax=Aphanomyces astaci TaxID=112090 RepID=A0A3R6ZIL3_APHAT|nr:hypothetical protein DYB34_007542 [Aphanomyces astaci]
MGDHSPTKKLKIAETVIRKLYKKNLELEKALVQAKADNQNQAQPAPYEHKTPETQAAKVQTQPRQPRFLAWKSGFSRQKQSYMKLKSDYKRLLLQRTRSISGSSEIDTHARELLALMEKRLLKVEDEREQDMALYNMKLYDRVTWHAVLSLIYPKFGLFVPIRQI